MPMPQNMLESEMIGAIKIKDGLFIGDELASTVSIWFDPYPDALLERIEWVFFFHRYQLEEKPFVFNLFVSIGIRVQKVYLFETNFLQNLLFKMTIVITYCFLSL